MRRAQGAEQKLPVGQARERLRETGQFWTPDWVADLMVKYALGGGAETVFDPAAGAGAFFRAARRAAPGVRLRGCELDPSLIREGEGVEVRDFALDPPQEQFAAIVANPPYIRHHRLALGVKQRLRAIGSATLGVHIDGRAGLHVYFLIRALERLAPGGRCAFIVPADIAEGVFAPALWRAIAARFRLDGVVTFAPAAAPFPRVDTNALIVMLSRCAPCPLVTWERRWELGAEGRSERVERELEELLATGLSRPRAEGESSGPVLGDYACVIRGIATCANAFFFMTAAQMKERKLPPSCFVRALGRTRDLEGDEVTAARLERLEAAGRPTYLLSLGGTRLPAGVDRYLTAGKAEGLPQRALLATRSPWYKMERREPPPFLFAYLGRRSARFIRNRAGVVPLTGFLCVYPQVGVAAERLWAVLQDARTVGNLARVGKSYGDGSIKVEPRALERLPLPEDVCAAAGLEFRPASLASALLQFGA